MAQTVRLMVLIDAGRLIDEVQARPPLWNTQIVSGKMTVERLWREVAEAVGTTGKDAKQKWKNLKDTFRKEMKKAIESVPSYTPVWPHYQRLSFLTEILLQSKRISYSNDEVVYASVHHQERFDSEDSNTENLIIGEPELGYSPKRRRETEDIVVDFKVEPDDDNVTGGDDTGDSSPQAGVGGKAEPTKSCAPRSTSQPANSCNCHEMDEDYHFFMSLMPHMKSFEPLKKLKIRNRIQDIFIREMSNAESRNDGATSSTGSAK